MMQLYKLKKTIKKSNLDSNSEEALENFKIYRNKIDSGILSNLRLLLLTKEDLKENREISSYLFSDFQNPINESNEKKCFQVIRNSVQSEIDKNERLKKNYNEFFYRTLEENISLVDYLHKRKDQVDKEELNGILSQQSLDTVENNILRNYYASLLDTHLLEQNLNYLKK